MRDTGHICGVRSRTIVGAKGVEQIPIDMSIYKYSYVLGQLQNNLLESTWDDDTNHLGIRIQHLEGVGGVAGDGTKVALSEQTTLLFVAVLLSPQLEPALQGEKVLIMPAVNVRQHA